MRKYILLHMTAMVLGFILDLLFGDPDWLPHPIRLIGGWISLLEKKMLGAPQREQKAVPRNEQKEKKLGICLVILVLLATGLVCGGLLFFSYRIHLFTGLFMESIMTYQILAMKCLGVESMRVYQKLEEKDLEGARLAVSRIVGRDTQSLDEMGVARAAIETVAENTSDGVIAPMLYTALGGPILGFLYKAVNTMDSMVGYKNDRYCYFGRAAAKLDDVVNYLPARISGLLMVTASFTGGKVYNGKEAWRIFKRDRYQHASPNSAQTESVCAGALGIRLAGNASYFGKPVKKPYIGDDQRPVERDDIKRSNRLMYLTAFLCEGCCLLIWGGVYLCMK